MILREKPEFVKKKDGIFVTGQLRVGEGRL